MRNPDPLLIVAWQPFFTVAGSAPRALAVLLFVALSIDVREIAEPRALRDRALAASSIPLVVLLVSGLACLPHQTRRSLALQVVVPFALRICAVLVLFGRARGSMRIERRYGLRTAVGVALIVVAIAGAALLAVGMQLGLGVLAAFCLVSLVWMVFNSWALLFAIADAEIAQEEPGTA